MFVPQNQGALTNGKPCFESDFKFARPGVLLWLEETFCLNPADGDSLSGVFRRHVIAIAFSLGWSDRYVH